MICVPIVGPTMAQAFKDISLARPLANLLELRLDLIENFDLHKLLEATGNDVIVTYRPEREGGQCSLNNQERISVLISALQQGAKWIDVEWDTFSLVPSVHQKSVILSRHFFDGFPDQLEEILETLNTQPAAVSKLAVKVTDIAQNARIFRALQNQKKPTILIGMGEEGLISRICSRVFGGFLTFASLTHGKESAPGQISIQELLERFHFQNTNRQTKLYGVVGLPISHSLSPDIHNAGFMEVRYNGLYLPLKVGDYQTFFQELAPFFHGLSVTIPYKKEMLSFIQEPSELLTEIGALNTMTQVSGGTWEGMNTDITAAITSLQEALNVQSLKQQKILVLGAGGASRAIIIGALKAGGSVTVTNRTVSKGKILADELSVPFIALEDIRMMETLPFEVIINTTSVGMSPHVEETPLPGIRFLKHQVVFDAIYNPDKTLLLQDAAADGATCITGREMFIKQGALQFERWVNQPAPTALFQKIIKQKLDH